MKISKINIPDSTKTFYCFDNEDFEFANPFEIFFNNRLAVNTVLLKQKLISENPDLSQEDIERLIYNVTVKESNEENQKLLNLKIPEGLLKLFDLKTKKEQINTLKSVALTSHEIHAFTLIAYRDFSYSYSLYTSKHHHKGLDKNKIPYFSFKDENGGVISTSGTNMTNGEIKQMLEHRKVTISKFFDNGDKWHCFFTTYKSIGGRELSYKDGQPHLHYISDAFGMKRDRVLSELRNEKYNLSAAPHIDFYTLRNPRKDH